jgi:hypothetical protein
MVYSELDEEARAVIGAVAKVDAVIRFPAPG